MRTQIQVVVISGIAAVICTLAGCSGPALCVKKDPNVFADRSITVHILGVTAREKESLPAPADPYWAYQYWTDYSGPDFPVPSDARCDREQVSDNHSIELGPRSRDGMWKVWKNRRATDVLVVADIPLDNGKWCERIPLDPTLWEGKTATVLIGEKGLSLSYSEK